MQNVVIDVERLALSPVLHDSDLSQVFLFLAASVGRARSNLFPMTVAEVAANVGIGLKTAQTCIDWLRSSGMLSIDGKLFQVHAVTISGDGWIDQDRIGFEHAFHAEVA
jgi:hypothetical protein